MERQYAQPQKKPENDVLPTVDQTDTDDDTGPKNRPKLITGNDGEFLTDSIPAASLQSTKKERKKVETQPENLFRKVDASDLEFIGRHYAHQGRLNRVCGLLSSLAVDLPWAVLELSDLSQLTSVPEEAFKLGTYNTGEKYNVMGLLGRIKGNYLVPIEVLGVTGKKDPLWKVWKLPKWLKRHSRTSFGLRVQEINQILNSDGIRVNYVRQPEKIIWEGDKRQVKVVADGFPIEVYSPRSNDRKRK